MPINIKYRNGRRFMLAAVIMFALVHVCGYLPTEDPRNLPMNWMSLTVFIPTWVWAVAWAVVIVVALWELFTGSGRKAISLTVCIMVASAAAFLASYILTIATVGWGSREWFYFGFYLFGAGIIRGLLMKVGALKIEPPEDSEMADE